MTRFCGLPPVQLTVCGGHSWRWRQLQGVLEQEQWSVKQAHIQIHPSDKQQLYPCISNHKSSVCRFDGTTNENIQLMWRCERNTVTTWVRKSQVGEQEVKIFCCCRDQPLRLKKPAKGRCVFEEGRKLPPLWSKGIKLPNQIMLIVRKVIEAGQWGKWFSEVGCISQHEVQIVCLQLTA